MKRTRHQLAPAVPVQQVIDRAVAGPMPDRFLVGRLEIVDVQHLAGAGCFGKARQQSLLLGQRHVLVFATAIRPRLAIAGCVIPLSRNSTIWMRWRCAAGIFHRSAVFSRRTSALLHLTICLPRIRWRKRITPRPRKTIRQAVYAAYLPRNSRFKPFWRWYYKVRPRY